MQSSQSAMSHYKQLTRVSTTIDTMCRAVGQPQLDLTDQLRGCNIASEEAIRLLMPMCFYTIITKLMRISTTIDTMW